MYGTIVIGIAGRPEDVEALALARRLGEPGATFTVISIAGPGDGLLEAGTTEVAAARLADAEAIVARFVADHPECEPFATSAPSVGQGIRHFAQGANADLVVVASSRRDLLGRVFAGDTVVDILRHAPCPVAVAPVGYAATGKITAITVGYDGSEPSKHGVEHALRIAARDQSTVNAIDVIQPIGARVGSAAGRHLPPGFERAEEDLIRLADQYGVRGLLTIGQPARELSRAGAVTDLLVVGFHDDGVVERLFYGSTSRALIHDQVGPILLVPAPTA